MTLSPELAAESTTPELQDTTATADLTTADLNTADLNAGDPSAAKAELRAQIRAQRKRVPAEERAARDESIQRHLLAALERHFPDHTATIAAFCAMPGEPGGQSLPTVLREAGYEVILPVVKYNPRRLEWRRFYGTGDLQANSMGILEPTGEAVGELTEAADVAVLPALALGSDGTRLGQGGGFYDRELADYDTAAACAPAPADEATASAKLMTIWALVDDSELRGSVPTAAHDLQIQGGISPSGFRALSA